MNNYEKNTLYSNTVKNNVDVYSSLLYKPSQVKQPKVTEQWSNNIYVFNKNNTKLLPCAEIEADNMIRSYVNLAHIQEGVKPRSRKTISKRLYPNKIYSSKPHIAHTNYEGNITVFIYDRKQKYLNYISNNSYDTITQLWKPKKFFNPHNKNREETNMNKAISSYSPPSYKGRKLYNNADRENPQIEFRFNTISRRLDSKKNTNDVTDRKRKLFPITNRWEKDTRKSNIVERSIDLGKNINVPNKEIESKKIRELDKVSRDIDIKSGTTEGSVVRRVFSSYRGPYRRGKGKPTHNKKSERYENSWSSKPDSSRSNTRAPFSIVKNNNIFKRYMSSETHTNIKSKKQEKNLPIINRVYRWSKNRNIFKPNPIGPIGRDKHKSSLIAFVSVNPTIVNKTNTKKSSVFMLPKPFSGKIKPRPLEGKKSKLFFLSYLSNLPYFLSSKHLVRKIRNMKRLKINKKNSITKMKKLEVKRNFGIKIKRLKVNKKDLGIKMKKLNINKKNLGIKMKRLSKSSSLFMTRSKVTLKKSKSCRLYRKHLQVRKVFVVKPEKLKLTRKNITQNLINKLNKPKGRMNKLNLLKFFFNKLSVIKPYHELVAYPSYRNSREDKTKKKSISEINPSCQSLSLFYALNVIDKTTMNKVAFFVDKINHSYKLNEDEKKYVIEFISNTLAVRDISFSSFSQSTYPFIKDNNNIHISNIIQEQNIAKIMLTDKKNLMYLQTIQQMYYNINKSNTWFALGMKSLLSQIYNKTITINIVNSKYIYLNADMLAELIASKLRIRSNNVLRIMKKALSMVRLGSRKDSISSIFNVEPSIPIGFDFMHRKTISLNNNFLNS